MEASLASDDCEYRPPGLAMGLSPGGLRRAGPKAAASSDIDYEADSDYSDDSTSVARRRRKVAGAVAGSPAGGVRKPGGAGGTRVLHRWTAEEHARLEALVRQYGTERNWALIAEGIRGRSGKQCRERWLNHMREGIIKGNWLPDEEFHLALCHTLVGNQWSQHCNRLRGRTENSIKNYWNATLRSKQANKRRGFLWVYIDKVRGALDDDSLRHRAFAETVATVYAQGNDWLPTWLRNKITAGELESPRLGEPLGRGWRRLLDREVAFLRDKDADVASTGIPFPNPASGGVVGGGTGGGGASPGGARAAGGRRGGEQSKGRSARGSDASQPARQQAAAAAPAEQGALQQSQLYYAPQTMHTPLPAEHMLQEAAPMPAGGGADNGAPRRGSLGLDLISSSDLDAFMAEGPLCAPHEAAGAAFCGLPVPVGGADGSGMASGSIYGGSSGDASGGDACDDDERLLMDVHLPDGLLPGCADGSDRAAAARTLLAPGLPRLIVTAPQQTWWGTSGPSFAAAVAAAAAGLNAAPSAGDTPPLSRNSSFCGSVGSTGATPTFSRLRLNSNSPAPNGGHPPPGGAFEAALAVEAATAPVAPFTAHPAGAAAATLQRPYQPSHLSTAPSYASDHSAGSRQPVYGSPAISTEVPGGALVYPAAGTLDMQAAAGQPAAGSGGLERHATCSSPFGSPHVQSGGAFGSGWGMAAGPVRLAGSAPPSLGGSPAAGQAGGQPVLSRFAAERHSCGHHPQHTGSDEAPMPFDFLPSDACGSAAASLSQQQLLQQALVCQPLHGAESGADLMLPPPCVPMRHSAAGNEGAQQRGECYEVTDDAAAAVLLPDPTRASCCDSVGSGGASGAAAGPGAQMTGQLSGGLGLLRSGSLSMLLLEGSSLFPDLPVAPAGAASGAAAAAGGMGGGVRRPSSAGGAGHLLSGMRSADLAAAINGLVRGDSMLGGVTMDQMLGEDV